MILRIHAEFVYKCGYKCFPGSTAGQESTSNAGDTGWVPGSGRSAGEEIGDALQYSWASLWFSW